MTTVYDEIAKALTAERVSTVFALMGDGNMLWLSSFDRLDGARVIHARHENMAMVMADVYSQLTGEVGVCTVTFGPGLTQVATSLTASVRQCTPMILLVGDAPRARSYHLQAFDQSPFVHATGAEFVAIRDPATTASELRRAFSMARDRRIPVVVSIPQDIQEMADVAPWSYRPAAEFSRTAHRLHPDPTMVTEIAAELMRAERPVIIAGSGAVAAGAESRIAVLADRVGALLGTTLKAHGWFRGHPFNLGLVGGFARPDVSTILAETDCVLAVGARMGHHTTAGGLLFPEARVLAVDINPVTINEGVEVIDRVLIADAAVAVDALIDVLESGERAGFRSEEIRLRIVDATLEEPAVELEPGTLDPRSVVRRLDAIIPNDAVIVVGFGHFWHFAVQHLHGREPRRQVYTAIGFGAIGQGLGAAVGAAAAMPEARVFLIDGDGGAMMNIQELETIVRHSLGVCVCILDDGAYGSETHRFRAWGMSEAPAVFGRPNFAAVAEGFGLRGHTLKAGRTDFDGPIRRFLAEGHPTLVDIHVSRTVPSSILYDAIYRPAMRTSGPATPTGANLAVASGTDVCTPGQNTDP